MLICILTIFFFNDTATTEIYTLSLHDALPICTGTRRLAAAAARRRLMTVVSYGPRSEEHTSELQSRLHLVCRLLLEKKKRSTICFYSFASCPKTLFLHIALPQCTFFSWRVPL